MIGFYDYTVILTYISLGCSVFGITQAVEGHFSLAILCLALSGLCDMFDGKIARTKKDRSEDEKLFGVQIDSLCDVICFGVFPSVIFYTIAGRGIITSLAMVYYCICSVIRLGFFNVLETNRQRVETGANKCYHGLPITSIAILLPIVSTLRPLVLENVYVILAFLTMIITGTLFIVNFRIKKPSNSKLVVLVAVTACAVIGLLVLTHFPAISQKLMNQKYIKVETVQKGELFKWISSK